MDPGNNQTTSPSPPDETTQHCVTPTEKQGEDFQAPPQTRAANGYETTTSFSESIEAPPEEAHEDRSPAPRQHKKGMGHRRVRHETSAQARDDILAFLASLKTPSSRVSGMAPPDASHEPEGPREAASCPSGMPTQIESGLGNASTAPNFSETLGQRRPARDRFQPTLRRISEESLQHGESSPHDESPQQ